jgi:hypothetical protein
MHITQGLRVQTARPYMRGADDKLMKSKRRSIAFQLLLAGILVSCIPLRHADAAVCKCLGADGSTSYQLGGDPARAGRRQPAQRSE